MEDGLTDFHQRDQRDEEYLERWLRYYEEDWPVIWAKRQTTIPAIPEPLGSKPKSFTMWEWHTIAA